MKRMMLRNNGLSVTMFAFFLIFLMGQVFAGHRDYNQNRKAHERPPVTLGQYLMSGHFLESVFENWESEFLQMAAYVLLTAFLFQKGSAESKDPHRMNAVDEDPRRHRQDPDAPAVVRKGGPGLRLYEHSLSLALLSLFFVSFAGHILMGSQQSNQERMLHGQSAQSWLEYLGSARFWFESFQNWQSEFLAVFAIVVLSIWLRERGSPESKPVAAGHRATGE